MKKVEQKILPHLVAIYELVKKQNPKDGSLSMYVSVDDGYVSAFNVADGNDKIDFNLFDGSWNDAKSEENIMTTQTLIDALTEGNAAKILQAAKDVGEAIKAGLIVELSALEKEGNNK